MLAAMRARPAGSRIGWLRVRSLILLALLVPVLGLVVVSGTAVGDKAAERDASVRLRDAAAGLRDGVDFRAAVATEEIHSTVLGLASDLDVEPDDTAQVDVARVRADLADARTAVDRARRDQAGPAVTVELARLDALRTDLDAGRAGQAEVSDVFADLNRALTEQWEAALARIERIADLQPQTGSVRARLRTLRYSIEAFSLGGPRINTALDLLLEEPTTTGAERLISLNDRFSAAVQRVAPAPGTEADRAWQAFQDDESVAATESTLDVAVDVGLGDAAPWQDLQLGLVAAGLADGERWGLRLTEVVGAAARDLADAAGRHADDAGDDVRNEMVLAAALVVASVVVGLATAAALTRPARHLQSAARRVEAGDFGAEPVPVRGPVELRETVVAFNDMAATLAAVEDHAVALAEDPTSTVLDDPLPGRTGQALQLAIDRLRASVHEAESHRAELFELATHDGLTGLLNRAAAFAAIEHDLSRARRDGTQLLAFYVDLDGLKSLNDTYGHDVGDEAIIRTAEALRSTTRDSDVVARLGGDEFMVVGPVPEGGREEIAAFAERIRAAVALQSVDVTADAVALRCSIGVALSDDGTGSAEALVRAADEAMYTAKHAGRDRVAWIDADPGPRDGLPT
jgi:diguanylate cyclase (GGDEF)-like protein